MKWNHSKNQPPKRPKDARKRSHGLPLCLICFSYFAQFIIAYLLLSLINKNIHLLNYILFLLDSSLNAFHLALVNLLLSGCCCCSIPSSIISPPLHPLFLSLLYLLSKRRDTQSNRKTNREERKEERRAPTPWAVELLPGIPSGFDEIHTEK